MVRPSSNLQIMSTVCGRQWEFSAMRVYLHPLRGNQEQQQQCSLQELLTISQKAQPGVCQDVCQGSPSGSVRQKSFFKRKKKPSQLKSGSSDSLSIIF